MRMALREAALAAEAGDVPIGAVIVHDNQIIGRAHNQVELLKDPTAHAEMIAITQAAAALNNWRLTSCALYVTKEPCPMCAGALTLARVPKIAFGAPDPKGGGPLPAATEILRGVLEADCRAILQGFFKDLRLREPEPSAQP